MVVVGLMIIPAAAASLLARSMGSYMAYTILIALLAASIGYCAAAAANVSIAGSVCAAAALLFVLVLLLSYRSKYIKQ